MPGKKLKKEKPVFTSTRKPTAPPSKKFGTERVEEKVHPSKRKSKHKRKPETEQ